MAVPEEDLCLFALAEGGQAMPSGISNAFSCPHWAKMLPKLRRKMSVVKARQAGPRTHKKRTTND